MLNKFPLWKNCLILLVITFGFVYAAPNFYPADAAIQVSGQSGSMVIDQGVLSKVEKALDQAGVDHFSGESDGESLLFELATRIALRAKKLSEMGLHCCPQSSCHHRMVEEYWRKTDEAGFGPQWWGALSLEVDLDQQWL